MKRKGQILLACLEALLVLAAIYFEPTYGVRGQLRGEAFFEGWPTSYWRRELERWDVNETVDPRWGGSKSYNFSRDDTWFGHQRSRWLPWTYTGYDEKKPRGALRHGIHPKRHRDAALHSIIELHAKLWAHF